MEFKMKYFIYTALFFICMFLFVPRTGTTEIRNQPLLFLILSLILLSVLIRFLKYVILMTKAKKMLKENKAELIKCSFLPWFSRFHGHYSIVFRHEEQTVQLIMIARKRKYQRYHFDSVDRLEFYRSNRIVFHKKVFGPTVSNLVETNLLGKQKLKWEPSADIRVVLFDRLPEQITDSVKKENIGVTEQICASNVYLLDWLAFAEQSR